MKNSIVVTIGMYAIAMLVAFFSVPHPHGAITMRSATEAHINVGRNDGIQVGDTLTVWRDEPAMQKKRNAAVGAVKVTKLVGAHYAAVQVVRGAPQVNDAVCKENANQG